MARSSACRPVCWSGPWVQQGVLGRETEEALAAHGAGVNNRQPRGNDAWRVNQWIPRDPVKLKSAGKPARSVIVGHWESHALATVW
jgi:hypothetical protein